MATTKYFSGTTLLSSGIRLIANAEFATRWPGVKGVKSDSFEMLAAFTIANPPELMPITRVIYRKARPSNHKCDARCQNAKGHNCECSCGGQFHGAGGAS